MTQSEGLSGSGRGGGKLKRREFLRTAAIGLAAGGILGVDLAATSQRADAAGASGDQGTLIIGGNAQFRTLDPGRTIEVTGMTVEN